MAKILDFIGMIILVIAILAFAPTIIGALGTLIVWVIQAVVIVFAITLVIGVFATLFDALFGKKPTANERVWSF